MVRLSMCLEFSDAVQVVMIEDLIAMMTGWVPVVSIQAMAA